MNEYFFNLGKNIYIFYMAFTLNSFTSLNLNEKYLRGKKKTHKMNTFYKKIYICILSMQVEVLKQYLRI